MTNVQTKLLQSVVNHRQLLDWLQERLLQSKRKFPINRGLVATALDLLDVVRDDGVFSMDPELWGDLLDLIFVSVMDSASTTLCPGGLIGFMSTAYGETIEHGEITIEDANRILIDILDYREKYLRVHHVGKRRYLESTPLCAKEFGMSVRVPLHQPERWRGYARMDDDGCIRKPLSDVRGHAER